MATTAPPPPPPPQPVQFLPGTSTLLLGPYQDTPDQYMERLKQLRATTESLNKAGFITKPLTRQDFDQKRKCQRCFKKLRPTRTWTPKPGAPTQPTTNPDQARGGEVVGKEPGHECKFHTGSFNGRVWSCCRVGAYNPPCQSSPEHSPDVHQPGELARLHQCHSTPLLSRPSHRAAVAMDCEMGVSITNDSVLIRLSVVDYFTSQVLVDSLVVPDEPILHYNTRFSGVNHAQMMQAQAAGTCLRGTAAARDAAWQFVGPDTIVVVHGGNNDFISMRWIHENIIDTMLVESLPVLKLQKEAKEAKEAKETKEKVAREMEEAQKGQKGQVDNKVGDTYSSSHGNDARRKSASVTQPGQKEKEQGEQQQNSNAKKRKRPKGTGPFALKTLARVRVGRDIQMGRGGHDSTEDALAARDVAHWNVLNMGHGVYQLRPE